MKRTKRTKRSISDDLRRAVRETGQSSLALAKKTGVTQPTISGFLAGRDMRLSRADKLARYLGLALRKRR